MLLQFHPSLRALLIVAGGLVPAMAEKSDSALVVPFLQEHCVDCLEEKKQKAKFALSDINPDIAGGGDLERWEKILEMISIGDMPPEDEVQPKAKQPGMEKNMPGMNGTLVIVQICKNSSLTYVR